MSLKTNSQTGLAFSLKLSILYAGFFVASSLALFFVAYFVIHDLVGQKEKDVIQERIREYSAWYREGGLRAIQTRFKAQSHTTGDIFFVRITGPLKEVLFVSSPPGTGGFDLDPITGPAPDKKYAWLNAKDFGKNTWTIGTTRLRGGYVLEVGKNSTRSQEFLSYFRMVFLKFVLPLLFFGIVIGGLLTFRAIRPIRQLIQTVRNILNTGDTSSRVPVASRRGELNALVGLFNQMLDKNDGLIRAMHDSLDNVAHDLKTPMTRLRGVAELALQKDDHSGDCREALADCMEESERVLTMLDTLMDVAEAQTGTMRLDKVVVSVPETIRTVVDLYEILAEEKQIRIHVRIPEALRISADRNRIRQITANLVDNAIKYSHPGGRIDITAREENNFALITVADKGMGIAPEEISKIWDRLYRGDRSRSTRGLGLGLSLVKAIVQAHGGNVRVESLPGKGSTFYVMLPGIPQYDK